MSILDRKTQRERNELIVEAMRQNDEWRASGRHRQVCSHCYGTRQGTASDYFGNLSVTSCLHCFNTGWEPTQEAREALKVADYLDAEADDLYSAGVFHQDEYGTYSANDERTAALRRAAEILRDLYPDDEALAEEADRVRERVMKQIREEVEGE